MKKKNDLDEDTILPPVVRPEVDGDAPGLDGFFLADSAPPKIGPDRAADCNLQDRSV
jgi:hypothetical protein